MNKLIFISALFIISIINDPQTFSQSEYLTKEGESLWNISILYYGSGEYWVAIWDANRNSGLLTDPNVVPAGVYLKIPELTGSQKKEANSKFRESMVNLKIITDCEYYQTGKSLECTNKSKFNWLFNEFESQIKVYRIPEYSKLEYPDSEESYDVKYIEDGTITDMSGLDRSVDIWYVNGKIIKYLAVSNEPYSISGYTFNSGFIFMQFQEGYQKVFSIDSQESLK